MSSRLFPSAAATAVVASATKRTRSMPRAEIGPRLSGPGIDRRSVHFRVEGNAEVPAIFACLQRPRRPCPRSGALWQIERVSMPAQPGPFPKRRAAHARQLLPAAKQLPCRSNARAQRGSERLSAEAYTEHDPVGLDQPARQPDFLLDPCQTTTLVDRVWRAENDEQTRLRRRWLRTWHPAPSPAATPLPLSQDVGQQAKTGRFVVLDDKRPHHPMPSLGGNSCNGVRRRRSTLMVKRSAR